MGARRVIGIILALMGAVWCLQGLGVIRSRSFMTDDTTWVVIGAISVLLGLGLALYTRRTG